MNSLKVVVKAVILGSSLVSVSGLADEIFCKPAQGQVTSVKHLLVSSVGEKQEADSWFGYNQQVNVHIAGTYEAFDNVTLISKPITTRCVNGTDYKINLGNELQLSLQNIEYSAGAGCGTHLGFTGVLKQVESADVMLICSSLAD